jgi:hypothetical protein
MKTRKNRHAVVVAYLALFMSLSGTAVASSGSPLILGQSNQSGTTTIVTSASGSPLSLNAPTGKAPLLVNSTAKVSKLNADLVDGLDSTKLQRRVVGSCPDNRAITSISSTGAVTCQSNDPAPSPTFGSSKGWTISTLQLSEDSLGAWDAVGRVTNRNAKSMSATFSVTVFRDDNSIAGVLRSSASSVPAGATYTVDFYSFDKYDASLTNPKLAFQTDVSYAS